MHSSSMLAKLKVKGSNVEKALRRGSVSACLAARCPYRVFQFQVLLGGS